MLRRRLLSTTAALIAGACATRPTSRGPRPAESPRAPDPDYYEAGGVVPAARSDVVESENSLYQVRRVRLPPRVPEPLRAIPRSGEPIEILWHRPKARPDARKPLILISPVLGNRTLLVTMFASRFAAMGYHGAIVFRKDLEFDPQATLEQAEDEMRLVVMRSRQALDWLLTQPDVDPARVGTFGVSAGAVISAIVAGTDARTKAHVLYLGGGPFADVVVDTAEERFQRYGTQTSRALGLSKEQVRARLHEIIVTDPVLVAPRVDREGVLMLVARNDRSVPTRYGIALWEAMGRPQLVTTPFGHHTTWVLLPWLETLAANWLRSRFGDPY